MGFAKKKILVTDDNRTFLMYISILMGKMGFHVIPAEDGLETMKIVKIVSPDLIMLDVNMSGIDGIKTLNYLKEDKGTADIPVVMVSNSTEKETVKKCLESGCAAYLQKPVDIGELNNVLQDCLFAPMDRRRKHLRAQFNSEVLLTHKGGSQKQFAVTLAEGGVYVRTKDPLPVGSKVEVTIPIKGKKPFTLKGFVIYTKGLFGDILSVPPGMAIEFILNNREKAAVLSKYVKEMMATDIIGFQEEPVIKIGRK